ncbi:MAG: SDR family oxidoreductase [Candidatus Omnitrophica bacterium]|nr:SDR family oxidoreductase [Candidatus Omnitrophota bacterium]
MSSSESKLQAVVIGANGLVGRCVINLLTQKGIECIGTCNKRPRNKLFKLDITDPEEINRFFSKFSPEVVFHCANLAGGVNFCQSNPKIATDFHLNATKRIGNACNANNATMFFISTDYVFDGTKAPYKENDPTNPLNLYGKLKLEAEEWIKGNISKFVIVRTTNVYGWDPETVTPNYVMGLYRTLKEGKPFNAPSFLRGNPTYANDLAEAIVELYVKNAHGLFHVVGKSFVDRLEWANAACEIFELNKSLLNETKVPSPDMVPRPLESNLTSDKFMRAYKSTLHDLASGLKLMKSDMKTLG